MQPEVQEQVRLPVVLLNRDGLYVIIAVLGVSILGCACVLTYSLGNYGKLMKYAEEVRNYIAIPRRNYRDTKAAVKEHSGGKQVTGAGGTGSSDARSVNVKIPMPNASAKGSTVDAGPSLGAGPNNNDNASVVGSVNDMFVVSAKQEEYGAAAADLQLWNASTAVCGSGNDSSSSGDAASAR